jgi:hypothetical protein
VTHHYRLKEQYLYYFAAVHLIFVCFLLLFPVAVVFVSLAVVVFVVAAVAVFLILQFAF